MLVPVRFCQYNGKCINKGHHGRVSKKNLPCNTCTQEEGLVCLTPLSTIFQLYCGG